MITALWIAVVVLGVAVVCQTLTIKNQSVTIKNLLEATRCNTSAINSLTKASGDLLGMTKILGRQSGFTL
jgi:hypothetical protein